MPRRGSARPARSPFLSRCPFTWRAPARRPPRRCRSRRRRERARGVAHPLGGARPVGVARAVGAARACRPPSDRTVLVRGKRRAGRSGIADPGAAGRVERDAGRAVALRPLTLPSAQEPAGPRPPSSLLSCPPCGGRRRAAGCLTGEARKGARDDPASAHGAARPAGGRSYPTYEGAQRAVDFLSDSKFPVERTAIIGSDLRMVETVLGRLTRGRAALAGAGSAPGSGCSSACCCHCSPRATITCWC